MGVRDSDWMMVCDGYVGSGEKCIKMGVVDWYCFVSWDWDWDFCDLEIVWGCFCVAENG